MIAAFVGLLLGASSLQAVDKGPPEAAARQNWTAEWIGHPTASLRDPGVFHYRKVIHLAAAPAYCVLISPNPGTLEHFEASMPHPRGEVKVRYRRDGSKVHFTITLPQGIDASMIWMGQQHVLHGGEQELQLVATTQP